MQKAASEDTVVHQCLDAQGASLLRLHRAREASGHTSFAFFGPAGLLLTIVVGSGTSRAFDGKGSELSTQQTGSAAPSDPNSGVRQVGESTVMVSGSVEGHPVWIVDDYLNHTRHFIVGAGQDIFLHVNLDRHGSITLTEKDGNHATRRVVRRDATGRLLADEATVQPGESLAAIARRCGVPEAGLLALNPIRATSTLEAGAVLRVA